MALHLCRACSSLLPSHLSATSDALSCVKCGAPSSWGDAPDAAFERTTKSRAREDPDWVVRWTRRREERASHGMETLPTAHETCPKCGENEAWTREQQTRSADEGSTVFYTCKACRHRWKQNN